MCFGLTNEKFDLHNKNKNTWFCTQCLLSSSPFSELDENQWLLFNHDINGSASEDVKNSFLILRLMILQPNVI